MGTAVAIETEVAPAFRSELLSMLPALRGFALSLTHSAEMADDLVQDTVERALRAHASFQIGTNMKAWLFFIARNVFLSGKRRSWRWQQMPVARNKDGEEVELDLTEAPPTQLAGLELDELREALTYLPKDQADALGAVAIDGLSYEEAADEFRTEIGTIKSRVSRARRTLTAFFAVTGAAQ